MYEETKRIDWKGIFLKVIILFLIILIIFKGYSLLRGKNNTEKVNTETNVVNTQSKIFVENLSKLDEAAKKYFEENKLELPTTKEKSTTITLNNLIEKKYIEILKDENGMSCDGNNSLIIATLENEKVQIKSTLICGSKSDYKLAYVEKTTNTECKEETVTESTIVTNNSTNNVTSNKQEVVQNTNKKEDENTPPAEIIIVTKPTQTTQKPIKYYTIKFDKNGGTKKYDTQQVKENEYVIYPGTNEKKGCSFEGWYYEGKLYNFASKVTKDMILTANYNCQLKQTLVTKTYSKYIYSLGWASKDVNSFKVNHTLKLPEKLTERDIQGVRIKSIVAVGPINNLSLVNSHKLNHDSFIYKANGWEYDITNEKNLSTINSSSVSFEYDDEYVSVLNASLYGFKVKWQTNNISKKCEETFEVKNVKNLCGYGIYYRVTWEYQIYE